MSDLYYNYFIQLLLIAVLISVVIREYRHREPEVDRILKALKNERFDKAYHIAKSRIYSVENELNTGKEKELFYIKFRKILNYLKKKLSKIEDKEHYNALGWAYNLLKDHENALKALRKAEGLDCSDPRILYNTAVAMRGLNRHRKALTYYRRALVLEPENVEALLGKADMSKILGMFKSAEEAYIRILEIDRNNERAMDGLALCFDHFKEYDKAKELYEKLETKTSLNADALYNLARYLHMDGDLERATELLERATQNDYYHAGAYYLKARIYAEKKDRELAIQNLSNAFRIDDSYKDKAKKETAFETYWLFSNFKELFE